MKRQREENPVAESGPLSKRRSMGRKKLERNKELCIFCEMSTSEQIHEFTFNANKSVSQMATEMGDMGLLVKLSDFLVAIEAKYHLNCLLRYRNRNRSHLRAKSDSSSSLHSTDRKAKARAFAELISHIEGCLEEDTNWLICIQYIKTVYKFGGIIFGEQNSFEGRHY